jgi:hypothetical protein
MSRWTRKVCGTAIALALAGTAAAQTAALPTDSGGTSTPPPTSTPPVTTATTAPGQARVSEKFSAPFITMAGSRENATALATALRTGSSATLTYTTVAADGTTTTTTTTITPPTKPMGWGNVRHSLALAQFALARAGVTNPTGEQLQAALQGGSFTTADGTSVTLDGVLQQRADGMGWGKIAQSYGTTMGAVNRGVRTSPAPVATTDPVAPTSPTSRTMGAKTGTPIATTRGVTTAGETPALSVGGPKRMTTAGGTSPGGAAGATGITTAGGTPAGTGHGGKGITTASSAASNGIVTAEGGGHGNGNAYGRGIVTASGSAPAAPAAGPKTGASSGIVTGSAGASGVVTANPGDGGGSAKANHGKGKSGG